MAKKAKRSDQVSPAPAGKLPDAAGSFPANRDEQLLTTRELMEFLNLSRTKIWELVTKECLPAFKIGGDYRYRRGEVLAWLERYRVSSEGKRR